jgi:hypothetical protein
MRESSAAAGAPWVGAGVHVVVDVRDVATRAGHCIGVYVDTHAMTKVIGTEAMSEVFVACEVSSVG